MEEFNKFGFQGARRSRRAAQGRSSVEVAEGILGQTSGTPPIDIERATSLTKVRTTDLLSEGQIQGLVTGSWRFTSTEGATGYDSAEFVRYDGVDVAGETRYDLQSIYYNEVPVIDREGKFNFQQLDFSFENGGPLPSTNGDVTNPDGNGLSVVRPINERLRGPNVEIDDKGETRTRSDGSEAIGDPEVFAKFYRILNPLCSSVNVNIKINSLFEINKTGPKTNPPGAEAGKGFGDTKRSDVRVKIYLREIFSDSPHALELGASSYRLAVSEKIEGKISQGYLHSIPVAFNASEKIKNDENFLGYEIKIVRDTPDSFNRDLANSTSIDSLIEYYNDRFGYPNSAIVSTKFNAEYFSSVPSRSFDTELLKVKIPSNYDTVLRIYSPAEWDGTFHAEKQWTDNPAWCFYDILTNKRYGLGEYISESLVDKWTLFKIAQYCDVMVPDGNGGFEPRFSCNALFSDRLDAYQALQDMASVFRGLTYYAGGTVRSFQDSFEEPLYTFSNSNIEDGQFAYQSTSQKSRFNSVLIRYNDKKNFYKPAIETVEDFDGIRRNGVIKKEITAIGVTSRAQAARIGKWILLSDNLETETVSFGAGMEAALLQPGDVFNIQDNTKTDKRYGGRILDITGHVGSKTSITLDSFVPLSGNETYQFSLVTPTYSFDPSIVSDLTSSDISGIRRSSVQTFDFTGYNHYLLTGDDGYVRTVITGDSGIFNADDYNISGNNVFTIQSSGTIDKNQEELFRTISIKEESLGKYEVQALAYRQDKFKKADGALDEINAGNFTVPEPPETFNLSVNDIFVNDPRFKKIDYHIESTGSGISSYILYSKKDDWSSSDFVQRGGTMTNATPDAKYIVAFEPYREVVVGSHVPSTSGNYFFRAYSRNKNGSPSTTPASGNVVLSQGELITNLKISELSLDTRTQDNSENPRKVDDSTSELSPGFSWNVGFKQTEATVDTSDLFFRVTIREPSDEASSIPSPVIYFEQTGIPLLGGENGFSYGFRYKDNFSGSAVIASNARPFPSYPDYVFPRSDMSQYLQTGLNTITGETGPFRNYDVVIEAHDSNGLTSVGYSLSNGNEGSGISSVYSTSENASEGYDILRVENKLANQVILTPSVWKDGCLAAVKADAANSFDFPYDQNRPSESNRGEVFDDISLNYPTATGLGAEGNGPTYFCTEQHLELNGDITIIVHRDDQQQKTFGEMNGFKDIAGGVIYYSDTWFNSREAKAATYSENVLGQLEAGPITSQFPANKYQYPEFTDTTEIVSTIKKAGFFVGKEDSITKGRIIIPANINSSKQYVAVSFIDDFEANQTTDDLSSSDALLANANRYPVSPTTQIIRRGEPDARVGFRAYLSISRRRVLQETWGSGIRVRTLNYSFRSFGFEEGTFELQIDQPNSTISKAHHFFSASSTYNYHRFDPWSHDIYNFRKTPPADSPFKGGRLRYRVTCTLKEAIPSESRIILGDVGDRSSDDRKVIFDFSESPLQYILAEFDSQASDSSDLYVDIIPNYHWTVQTRDSWKYATSSAYGVFLDLPGAVNRNARTGSAIESRDTALVSIGILWNGQSSPDQVINSENVDQKS